MTTPTRCGICGRDDGRHFQSKHDLFERMLKAPAKIEPLSPLANEIERAREADKAKGKP